MGTAPANTTWGDWKYGGSGSSANGMRVGISVNWSSVAWNSTTATATVTVWTTNQFNHDGDATRILYSGFDNNTTLSFTNNEDRQSIDGDTQRDTRYFTYTYSNPSPTFTATVTDTYWGGTTIRPTVSGTFAPPTRPAQPPDPPTMGTLSLTAGIRSISLSWGLTSNNRATVDRYDIYRNSVYLTTVYGESNRSYNDTGLANGTTYNYTVYAYNSAGWSGPSNTPSATTASLPTAPGSLTANNSTFGQIGLSWTASDGYGYSVTYSISRTPGTYTSSTSGLSVTDTTVLPYTDYTYTVTATTSVGSTSSSVSVKSMGGIAKVFNSISPSPSYVTVLPKVYNGSTWLDAQARIYDGIGATEDAKWKHGI